MPAMTREELLWQKLVDEAGEELIEQAAAVSVAQAEKELAEAGFDVAAERARAESFLASLEGVAAKEAVAQEAPESRPRRAAKSERKGSRPTAVWKATAAAVAVAAGTAVIYVTTRPEDVQPATPPPTGTDAAVNVAELRKHAAAACDASRFDECLSLLDQAAARDPAGDKVPAVQELRKKVAASGSQPTQPK